MTTEKIISLLSIAFALSRKESEIKQKQNGSVMENNQNIFPSIKSLNKFNIQKCGSESRNNISLKNDINLSNKTSWTKQINVPSILVKIDLNKITKNITEMEKSKKVKKIETHKIYKKLTLPKKNTLSKIQFQSDTIKNYKKNVRRKKTRLDILEVVKLAQKKDKKLTKLFQTYFGNDSDMIESEEDKVIMLKTREKKTQDNLITAHNIYTQEKCTGNTIAAEKKRDNYKRGNTSIRKRARSISVDNLQMSATSMKIQRTKDSPSVSHIKHIINESNTYVRSNDKIILPVTETDTAEDTNTRDTHSCVLQSLQERKITDTLIEETNIPDILQSPQEESCDKNIITSAKINALTEENVKSNLSVIPIQKKSLGNEDEDDDDISIVKNLTDNNSKMSNENSSTSTIITTPPSKTINEAFLTPTLDTIPKEIQKSCDENIISVKVDALTEENVTSNLSVTLIQEKSLDYKDENDDVVIDLTDNDSRMSNQMLNSSRSTIITTLRKMTNKAFLMPTVDTTPQEAQKSCDENIISVKVDALTEKNVTSNLSVTIQEKSLDKDENDGDIFIVENLTDNDRRMSNETLNSSRSTIITTLRKMTNKTFLTPTPDTTPQEAQKSCDENIISVKVDALTEENVTSNLSVTIQEKSLDKDKNDDDIFIVENLIDNNRRMSNETLNSSTSSIITTLRKTTNEVFLTPTLDAMTPVENSTDNNSRMLNNSPTSRIITSPSSNTISSTNEVSLTSTLDTTHRSSVNIKDVPLESDDDSDAEVEIKVNSKSKSIPQFTVKMSLSSMSITSCQGLNISKHNALFNELIQNINSFLKVIFKSKKERNNENDTIELSNSDDSVSTKSVEIDLNTQNIVPVKESSSSQITNDNIVPSLQQQDSSNDVTLNEEISTKEPNRKIDKECVRLIEPKATLTTMENNPKSVESTSKSDLNKSSKKTSLNNRSKNVDKHTPEYGKIRIRSIKELTNPKSVVSLPANFNISGNASSATCSTFSQFSSGPSNTNTISEHMLPVTNPSCMPIENITPHFNRDISIEIQNIIQNICKNFKYCRKFSSQEINEKNIKGFSTSLTEIKGGLNYLLKRLQVNINIIMIYINQIVQLTPPISFDEYYTYTEKLICSGNLCYPNMQQNLNPPRHQPRTSSGSLTLNTNTQPYFSTATNQLSNGNIPLNFNSMANINAQQSFGNVLSSSLHSNQTIPSNDQERMQNVPHMSYFRQSAPSNPQQHGNVTFMTHSDISRPTHQQQNNCITYAQTSNQQLFRNNILSTMPSDATRNVTLCTICNKFECQHNSKRKSCRKNVSKTSTKANNGAIDTSAANTQQHTLNLQTLSQRNMGMPMYPPSTSNQGVFLNTYQTFIRNMDAEFTASEFITIAPNASLNFLQTSNATTNITSGNLSIAQQMQIPSISSQCVSQNNRSRSTTIPIQDIHRNTQPSVVNETSSILQSQLYKTMPDLRDKNLPANAPKNTFINSNNSPSNILYDFLNRTSELLKSGSKNYTLNKTPDSQRDVCQTTLGIRNVTQSGTTKASSQMLIAHTQDTTPIPFSSSRDRTVSSSAECTKADPTDYNLYYKFNLSFLTDIQKIILHDNLQYYMNMPQDAITQQEYENLLCQTEKLLFFYISLDKYVNRIKKCQSIEEYNTNLEMQLSDKNNMSNMNSSVKSKSTSVSANDELVTETRDELSTPESAIIDFLMPSEASFDIDDEEILAQCTNMAGERTIEATFHKNSEVEVRDNITINENSRDLRDKKLPELLSSQDVSNLLKDTLTSKTKNQSHMSGVLESYTNMEISNDVANKISNATQQDNSEQNNAKTSYNTENQNKKVDIFNKNQNKIEKNIKNNTSYFVTENQLNPLCTSSTFNSSNNVSELLATNESKSVNNSLVNIRNTAQVEFMNKLSHNLEVEEINNIETDESIESRLCIDEDAETDLESSSIDATSNEHTEDSLLKLNSPKNNTSIDSIDLYVFATEEENIVDSNEQASKAKETQLQKSAVDIPEVTLITRENTVQSIDSVSKEMEQKDIEFDTHSKIKLFNKQFKCILENDQKSQIPKIPVIAKLRKDYIILNIKPYASNDSNAAKCNSLNTHCETASATNICNIKSISSLIEKIENADIVLQELKLLTEEEKSSSADMYNIKTISSSLIEKIDNTDTVLQELKLLTEEKKSSSADIKSISSSLIGKIDNTDIVLQELKLLTEEEKSSSADMCNIKIISSSLIEKIDNTDTVLQELKLLTEEKKSSSADIKSISSSLIEKIDNTDTVLQELKLLTEEKKSSSADMCNIKTISSSLIEKIDNTDTVLQELKSLTEMEKSSIVENNLKERQEKNNLPCLRCKKNSSILCGNCLEAHYCSKRCSHLHWKSFHHQDCKNTKSMKISS